MRMEQTGTRKKEPLIRTEKREELTKKQTYGLRLLAFCLALVAGGVFMLCLGFSPVGIYGTILYGAFRSSMAIQATVKNVIPLVISALGVTLAFKMRFWNIGAEGQIIMGAVCSSYFALFHYDWPHIPLMIVMMAAGAVGGGIWALIPAIFKNRYNTNETLFTLMLNYIALDIIVLLRDGNWKDPNSSGFPKIARFKEAAQLDKVFGVQAGWIIALVLVALIFIYLKYTKRGYEISVIGQSESTAAYAGMHVKKIIFQTMFLSGAICGIGGMVQSSGSDMTLATSVAGGVGFTAIIVAWLANLNPIAILMVSILFGILEKGCSVMQSTYGLSTDSADILQGILLFFVLACEFFIRYRLVVRRKGGR